MQEAFSICARWIHLINHRRPRSPDPLLLISPQICRCRGSAILHSCAIAMETKHITMETRDILLKIAVMQDQL